MEGKPIRKSRMSCPSYHPVLLVLSLLVLGTGCLRLKSYPRYTGDHAQVRMHTIVLSVVGTPYKWGGDDISGMDCSGLVVYVFQKSWKRSLPHSVTELFETGHLVDPGKDRLGDLLFFAESGYLPDHVGISLGGGRFVHASSERGVIIALLETDYFRKRYIATRRIER